MSSRIVGFIGSKLPPHTKCCTQRRWKQQIKQRAYEYLTSTTPRPNYVLVTEEFEVLTAVGQVCLQLRIPYLVVLLAGRWPTVQKQRYYANRALHTLCVRPDANMYALARQYMQPQTRDIVEDRNRVATVITRNGYIISQATDIVLIGHVNHCPYGINHDNITYTNLLYAAEAQQQLNEEKRVTLICPDKTIKEYVYRNLRDWEEKKASESKKSQFDSLDFSKVVTELHEAGASLKYYK